MILFRPNHKSRNQRAFIFSSFIAVGLSILSVQSFAQTTPDIKKLSPQAQACHAMENIDFEAIADNPVQIRKIKHVTDAKEALAFNFMFEKRSVVQGLPMVKRDVLPAHCRIEGYVAPAVKFLLLLPDADDWNGNVIYNACEAFCGAVNEDSPIPALVRGYAAITTDGGHINKRPFDGVWGHNNVEGEKDFSYRASHVAAQTIKGIAAHYYGKAHKYAYITGFSKGGHAGIKSALTYPEDYNGVLSRAPVVRYQEINSLAIPYLYKANTRADGTHILLAKHVPLIHKAAIDTCDMVDGANDGIIADPRECNYDPSVLLCKPDQASDTCLTDEQVGVLRKFYAAPADKNGKVFYPYPLEVGSELDWRGFHLPQTETSAPYDASIGRTYLRYMAFKKDPGAKYDWLSFNPTKEKRKLNALKPMIDAYSGKLKKFHKAGGKMIVLHGWGDGAVGPRMSIDWHEKVRKEMRDETDNVARLFVIPGNKHGGSESDGPNVNDSFDALVNWVENGVAPEQLLFRDTMKSEDAKRTRVVFPYPAYAQYNGTGDLDKASSFEKRTPPSK